jgi:Raf kinase inhibitor-like YbhB/YbcL family protein
MRTAYLLLGLLWLVVLAGAAYAFNHNFTPIKDTAPMATSTLTLTSPAFEAGESIPSKFTCDGEQTSPQLRISGVPAESKSLALIMDDPDVPRQLKPDGMFDHWVVFNIPPDTKEIMEGGTPGVPGANGAGKNAYTGPCPPKEYEPNEHRYFFKLYALDSELDLKPGASKSEVEKAMEGHIIAQTELIGRYKRQ